MDASARPHDFVNEWTGIEHMKIVVLIKPVSDTWGERHLNTETGWVYRDASEAVIDEVGERAIEAALVYKDSADAEVVVMTMGPASAKESLRKGLAMGAEIGRASCRERHRRGYGRERTSR